MYQIFIINIKLENPSSLREGGEEGEREEVLQYLEIDLFFQIIPEVW